MSNATPINRPLIRVQDSEPVTDGDGVKIQRSVASRAMQTYDPFLLLDEIAGDDAADYIGGFPEHPHRGFETVTYMLEGQFKHRDHLGNEGLLVSGGVQWMTAGRGVLHSEMPEQQDGNLHGFQLWINLPAAEKMSAPNYREFKPEQIPLHSLSNHSQIKVIAGTAHIGNTQITGPVTDVTTQPDYFDIRIATGEQITLPVADEKRVLLYPYQGQLQVVEGNQSRPLKYRQLGMLGGGNQVTLRAEEDTRLLLLAGKPINEPIAQWGPFVMNTRQEIDQAIRDFHSGNLV